MDKKEQGQLLRAWRKYEGARRGRKLSLMELAGLVSERAEQEGYKPDNRRIPGSHAAMTRWELGGVEQSITGLQLIADIYGVSVIDLMQRPPDAPPKPEPTAPQADDIVEAFRTFMASRKKG